MWEVDHIKRMPNNAVLLAFTKIGTYAVAPPEEIYILYSPNLLTEEDPHKVTWQMLPNRTHGVEAPNGQGDSAGGKGIAEEPHVVPMQVGGEDSGSSVYMNFRTSQGYLGAATGDLMDSSSDAWPASTFAEYRQPHPRALYNGNSTFMKNPRGPISPKRQPNGLVLMTYYNNGGFAPFAHISPVSDRNNMWLTVGQEEGDVGNGTTIRWSQPELALYDRSRSRGHGYPDLVTVPNSSSPFGFSVYITETYKNKPNAEARVHHVDEALLALLFRQDTIDTVASGVAIDFSGDGAQPAPQDWLPDLSRYSHPRAGFTLDMWIGCGATASDGASISQRLLNGTGFTVEVTCKPGNATAAVSLQDDNGTRDMWATDPVCSKALASRTGPGPGGSHYLALVVDAGPLMVMWFVDGKLCDGGPDQGAWAAGWHLLDASMGSLRGASVGNLACFP